MSNNSTMFSIQERFAPVDGGGILYDATRFRKAPPDLFDKDHWRTQGALAELAGGRSSIALLRLDTASWVLRHYLRGGWMAKLTRDRYFWLGRSRTRSFAEWRLLARLRNKGLPVPAPVAARYVKRTFSYQADLITEHLPECRTLADALTGASLSHEHWSAVGETIALFHGEGVHHADLNANNILIGGASDAVPGVYLLDFDRGRIRARGAWESAVLARLRRSLEKIRAQRRDFRFGEQEWQWLLEGYGMRTPR